ncbi:Cysteine desulfurase IscS [Candidatus Desulfarcum epimagneticum]|uniref:cysteine desulfurase n=1 Tax=uncultured Desulfobacteraceae bacterium TaxID=218296 RepID=A0A484HK76_9BACT|nr:Cysteine desulfurase IscS [uncultured Desulfobacteraceae bacterium]
MKIKMTPVNLDHISANHILPEARDKMVRAMEKNYGNPSGQNSGADEAILALDEARESVARLIHCKTPREVVFTSGGTESVNHAIKGAAFANSEKGRHIVTTNIEHNSANKSLKRLSQMGFSATSVGVDSKGRVNPDDVAKAITDETILVSVMHSNNEIGTFQPIEEISKITKEKKILFHSDAVDSVGVVPVDVQKLGVDLMSFASNPYYGPVGVGGLYVRQGVRVWPILDGGIQERNKRAGTENIIGIVGMGEAARLARENMDDRIAHIKGLRDLVIEELPNHIDNYYINGDPENGLPNLLSVAIRYIEGESIVLMLDDDGYRVSTRSACATGSLRASHVLMSIGLDHADAQGVIMVTPGIENTREDIMGFLKSLQDIVKSLRDISPLCRKTT